MSHVSKIPFTIQYFMLIIERAQLSNDNPILFYIRPSGCTVGKNTVDMSQIQIVKQLVHGRDDVIVGT